MKQNIKAKYNTLYEFILRDVTTGEIKQNVKTHNVVLRNLLRNEYTVHNSWTTAYTDINKLGVGTGTGTPSHTNTGLFSEKWSFDISNARTYSYSNNYKTGIFETYVVIPATASYVANITEVGLASTMWGSGFGGGPGYYTHAMLYDAEGNQISINKTDLDELTITVRLELTLDGGEDFYSFPMNISGFGKFTRGQNHGNNGLGLGHASMSRTPNHYLADKAGYTYQGTDNYETTDMTLFPRPSYAYSSGKFTFNNSRIVADKGNTHYYNSIALNYFGCWPLPNPDIFPYYYIENIEIGVGDGVTTEFKNPLNYFVEGTQTITLDGVVLDPNEYTIDHMNNADKLTEITAGNFAYCHSEMDVASSTSYYPIFKACDKSSFAFTDSGNRFSATAPLFIECEKVEKINTMRLKWFKRKRTGSSSTENLTSASFKLSKSDDGIDYTEVITTDLIDAYAGADVTFETVEAKYFKLEVVAENYLDTNEYYFSVATSGCYPACTEAFFGYVGDPNITFATPPAEGAVIKMTVQMDRPFKNENFVIDVTGTITLDV